MVTGDMLQNVVDAVPVNKIDLIHVQHEYGRYHGFEDWFFNSLKALKKPIVTTMHTTGYRPHVDRAISNASKELIVHNSYMSESLGRDCTVIAHGCLPPQPHVDKEMAKRLTAVPVEAPVIGYVGFISEVKGIETLIEAMIQVPNAALVIAGGWFVESETSYIKMMKDWSLKELKGRCIWLGYVGDSRLATTYSAMDIVVYPSRVTSESGALLMALSHGKPVLASDIAAFRDKKPAFDTFKDVDDLVKKLHLWLKERKYTKMYEANARKYVKEHSWPAAAEQHLKVYERALKSYIHNRLFTGPGNDDDAGDGNS